jgi:hypothetical protein
MKFNNHDTLHKQEEEYSFTTKYESIRLVLLAPNVLSTFTRDCFHALEWLLVSSSQRQIHSLFLAGKCQCTQSTVGQSRLAVGRQVGHFLAAVGVILFYVLILSHQSTNDTSSCISTMTPLCSSRRSMFWASSSAVLLFLVLSVPDLRRRGVSLSSEQSKTDHNRLNEENRINRIYFTNLDTNPARRAFMEGWLSKQTIPFERIPPGEIGDPSPAICVEGKTEPNRCRGIAGIAKSDISIIDSYDTTGLSLVFEDDHYAENITRLQESISVVPDDWDIIRFNCWGDIPSDFPFLHVKPGNELQIEKVFETRHNKEQPPCDGASETCWYCGGTHAMLWRGSRVQKLRKIWSRKPYAEVDCLLTDQNNLTSYCINFPDGQQIIHKKIKGEITNIPHNDSGVEHFNVVGRDHHHQHHQHHHHQHHHH